MGSTSSFSATCSICLCLMKVRTLFFITIAMVLGNIFLLLDPPFDSLPLPTKLKLKMPIVNEFVLAWRKLKCKSCNKVLHKSYNMMLHKWCNRAHEGDNERGENNVFLKEGLVIVARDYHLLRLFRWWQLFNDVIGRNIWILKILRFGMIIDH